MNVFNIHSRQRKAVRLHPEWLSASTQVAVNSGEDVEKEEPSFTAGVWINQYNYLSIIYRKY